MNILFVCAGNTCRSCMAEAIFNNINDISDIHAISAGVAVVENSITSKNAGAVVREKLGMDISSRKAVQITGKHLEEADLILTMTNSIKGYLVSMFPNLKNKIYTLNEYVGEKGDVIDPYGGDVSVYSNTFNSLKDSLSLLLAKLKEDNSI